MFELRLDSEVSLFIFSLNPFIEHNIFFARYSYFMNATFKFNGFIFLFCCKNYVLFSKLLRSLINFNFFSFDFENDLQDPISINCSLESFLKNELWQTGTLSIVKGIILVWTIEFILGLSIEMINLSVIY